MSKIGEKVKNMLRNWLQIQPAAQNSIVLQEPLSHQASVIRNQIWYRGEAAELEQLYKQLGAQDSTNAARFWAAVPGNDTKLRKIHSGLPATLVIRSPISSSLIWMISSSRAVPGSKPGRISCRSWIL